MPAVPHHKAGSRTQKQTATCHENLQTIIKYGLKYCPVDFGVVEGHRPVELQYMYFLAGKSKIDGKTKKGKHNLEPSEAFDFIVYVAGQKTPYDREHLIAVAHFIMGVAAMLYEQGIICHLLRWGGNWDMDSAILIDQSFDDMPHLELIEPQK